MRAQCTTSSALRRSIAAGVTAAALLCFLIGFFTASASAAPEATHSYAPGAFFGSQGTDPGQFSEPRQIAAEPATGNLLVADSGNGRVQVFATDPAGNPSFLTTLGAGTLTTPFGIAVDPGTGAIYVSDSGAAEVFRFTSDGAATPTYALDATFSSPTLASYASTLAVDPTTHDLIVADTGSQEVRRFDVADGSQISTFNGSTTPDGQFTSLRSVAVAPSGTVYVVDEPYPNAIHFQFGAGRVERFNSAGDPLGQLQGIDQEGAVSADPISGTVAVGWHNNFDARPTRVAQFEGADTPALSVDVPADGATASIAYAGSGTQRIYALIELIGGFFGSPGIQPLRQADVPGAELDPITNVSSTTAHLSGSVAPGTLSGPGTVSFEYSLDGSTWLLTAEQTGISGPGATAVSADVTGLRPNSTYSVRLHASNDDFSANSPMVKFNTSPAAPEVGNAAARDRSTTSATLSGRVNPFGQQTTYYFEYGETNSYGRSAPAGYGDVAGGGFKPLDVSAMVFNLRPETTYHYRLVATNPTGTSATPDATFTTRFDTDTQRAYEQVTPIDKGGAVVSGFGFHQSSPDGEAIVYQTKNAMGLAGVQSAPVQPRYGAHRTPSGWTWRPLDPPQIATTYDLAVASLFTIAASPDKSHVLVVSNRALTPDAVSGSGNLYRRDVESGNYELVTTVPYGEVISLTGMEIFYGGNADFSRIYLLTPEQLTPDTTPGNFTIYEWTPDQGLRAASPVDGSLSWPVYRLAQPEHHFVSADGSAYFSTAGGANPGIYRTMEGDTVLLMATPGAPAAVLDVSTDGHYVAYSSEGAIYRYDTESATSELVFSSTVISGGAGYMGMSADGSTLLDTGSGANALSVWRNGTLTDVASTVLGTLVARGIATSPNGRYVTFTSFALLGQTYDNSGCPFSLVDQVVPAGRCLEAYVYDADEQVLTCISCPADGSPSIGHAHVNTTLLELGLSAGRRIIDDGSVLFDTPAKLVAADQNGVRDVYLYRDGEAELISPGSGPHSAYIADGSAGFRDVFFVTNQQLVGQDRDNQFDLYDARIGGGIPQQSSSGGEIASCTGLDCRAPLSGAQIPAPVAGSESITNQPQKHRKKSRKHKHRKPRKKQRVSGRDPGSRPSFGVERTSTATFGK